ncbi:hypothetical protein [Niabella ginsengisoli]|uniref:hypothetical protein n=1 Tax=Niabella ginsengisoli TaxID=522298 RepID=UPI00374DCFFE
MERVIGERKDLKKSTQKISVISRKLAKACRESVSAIYPYCGLAATSQHSEINRVFRDVFTASQHGLLAFA